METCQSILLAEMPNSNIAKCLRSGLVRWYFKNLMVTFRERDFIAFSKSFAEIDFDHKSWLTEEGHRFVVINTCHQDIQFVFKEQEHERICNLLEKARTVLEIQQILKN